jgi:hypothetical protein
MSRTPVIFLLLSVPAFAADICQDSKTLEAWIQCKLMPISAAPASTATKNNPTKQATAPAIASSAPSLVDHTTLADFATAAVNVAGYGNTTSAQSPSATTTISAYAIYGALNRLDPMDPELYDRTAGWRQVTFTVGTNNSSTASSMTSSQSTAGTASKVIGASYLIFNSRDLASKHGQKVRLDLAADKSALVLETIAVAKCVQTITELVGDKFDDLRQHKLPATSSLPAEVAKALAVCQPDYSALQKEINDKIAEIQKAPQLSISGQALIGSGAMATSDYRGQLAFEAGLPKNFNFTANASFDYINSPKIGADTRGARVATDLQYIFKRAAASSQAAKSPVSVEVSGEGDWFQSYNPSYVGQVKLTIPIATGVDFPISASYGSKSSLLHEQHLVGKFGLTFDVSKIASSLLKK